MKGIKEKMKWALPRFLPLIPLSAAATAPESPLSLGVWATVFGTEVYLALKGSLRDFKEGKITAQEFKDKLSEQIEKAEDIPSDVKAEAKKTIEETKPAELKRLVGEKEQVAKEKKELAKEKLKEVT